MPNHYTTEIKLKGSQAALSAFMERHVKIPGFEDDKDAPQLDFNTVIPMPDVIKNTESSSTVDNGLMLLGRGDLLRDRLLRDRFISTKLATMLEWPWVKEAGVTTVEGLKKLLLEREPDCIKKAQAAIAAHEQTGFISWYNWSVANWGTKWNSYDLVIAGTAPQKQIKLTFHTAWAPPTPVIRKLIELHPDLTFAVRGHDEGERRWKAIDLAA